MAVFSWEEDVSNLSKSFLKLRTSGKEPSSTKEGRSGWVLEVGFGWGFWRGGKRGVRTDAVRRREEG